jgi:hypothetical protein
MDPYDLLIDALATYRLTRLATADVISEPLRSSVVGRVMGSAIDPSGAHGPATALEAVEAVADPPKVARLITCRWCAGMWIAGGVVAARAMAPKAWRPVGRALALSAGAALLARFETD